MEISKLVNNIVPQKLSFTSVQTTNYRTQTAMRTTFLKKRCNLLGTYRHSTEKIHLQDMRDHRDRLESFLQILWNSAKGIVAGIDFLIHLESFVKLYF